LSNCGIATSGTYERGQHIYNPITKKTEISDIVSLTVIGPNVFEADKFSTPAFAMGKVGIEFIESLPGFDGYMIDKDGIATMTSGFDEYTRHSGTQ
jgi:thiamine biosynthesis lipoprotein